MTTVSDKDVAKAARKLLAPSLDKLYAAASGRRYAKLRQDAKDLLDQLPSILAAPPAPAKPAGRRPKAPAVAAPDAAAVADAAASVEEYVRVVIDANGSCTLTVQGPTSPLVSPREGPSTDAPAPLSHGLSILTPAEVQAAEAAEDPSSAPAADFQVLPTPPGLNTQAALSVLQLMRVAVETRRPPIVEIALDCIQNLIAHKLLSGPVFSVNHRREGDGRVGGKKGDEDEEGSKVDPDQQPPQAQALELLCLCDDISDEIVERRVLKGLLTAVTSTTIFVHGQALLLAVRACYNIFLMSRDETKRVTAKAALTQMINAVFQRMEAGDFVLVKPIVVTDMLGMPSAEINSMSAAVESFLHDVMTQVDITGMYVSGFVEGIQQQLDSVFGQATTPRVSQSAPATPPPPAAPQNTPATKVAFAADVQEAVRPSTPPPSTPSQPTLDDVPRGVVNDAASSVGATDGGELAPSIIDTPLASPPPEPADGAEEPMPSTPPDAASLADGETNGEPELAANEATAVDLQDKSAEDTVVAENAVVEAALVTEDGHVSPPATAAPEQLPGTVGEAAVTDAAAVPSAVVRTPAQMVRIQALLQKDAFLVFRALCKLSIKTADASTTDQAIIRGKELALQLLKIVLENSGDVFRSTDKFISAIKQYLCLSLLKNCTSSVQAVQRLSCSIFLTLLVRFRQSLKAEIGLFYPMILLRPIEPIIAGAQVSAAGGTSAVDASHKQMVLKCLEQLTQDGQLLVDLFVNYDCDLEGANLFERTVAALVRIAQGGHTDPGTQLPPEERLLRLQSLRCLINTLIALVQWYARGNPDSMVEYGQTGVERKATMPQGALPTVNGLSSHLRNPSQGDLVGNMGAKSTESVLEGDAAVESLSFDEQALAGAQLADILKKALPIGADPAAVDAAQAQLMESVKEYKKSFQQALVLFNKKPKKGLAVLQEQGFVGTSPEEVARFLSKTQGLNKTMIGEYMGEKDDFCIKVMHAYTDALDFTEMTFDDALRRFLDGFRLPGEAQKIDRFMLKFAERYTYCNAHAFASANVAYVLAYAVIMLNTDAHNPMVKKKMTKQDFLRNSRGINEGSDLNEEYMCDLYDRIVNNEIKLKDDFMSGGNAPQQQAAQQQRDAGIFSAIMGLIPGRKQQAVSEPSDDAIKRTHDFLREQAKGATFFTTMDGETAQPMVDIAWAPMLGAFSVNFEQFDDEDVVELCLAGFRAAIRLQCLLNMTMLRNTYLSSLGRFTMLHSPASMRMKHARAFKTLLVVAEENGNHMAECWEDVLRCISRFELLQQLSAGLPTDALLFGGEGREQPKKPEGLSERLGVRSLFRRTQAQPAPANDTAAVEQGFFLYLGKAGKKDDLVLPPPEVLQEVDQRTLDRLYVLSDQLDSDAVVTFARTLCKISGEELKSVQHPRVFSLTKIVEISHFNMGRIRIVWSRIWSLLSDFFIEVGCHKNLQVAMYAVDSLRQLSMKFLERDELANFTFQNDFLRPFVFVMRQSKSVEIRELIIRCVSQMILARVANVKSGWKSMFMVFTTAANDEQPQVVRLAFDTIEKIVREYFSHITETETTTFTDCVNCLIAFTNNPHSLDVSLNAIAFLRYCAIQLAEGEIALQDLDSTQELAVNVDMFRVRDLMSEETQTWSSSLQANWADKFADSKDAEALAARKAQHEAQQAAEQRSSAGGSPPRTASTSSIVVVQAGASLKRMRFTDKDEHMYFWFPLLAGLSELTFDPRQEIRQSALEVLFDTLEFHGHSFTPQFWARVFDSVLLPIFDHVRAEVTDTTTFTDERRRADVDAWLYETCTQCLQHIVDLVVKFFPVVQDLLGRILDLLEGFVRRPHHSLAAVGVAAMTRLVVNAGINFPPRIWTQVLTRMATVSDVTLPNVQVAEEEGDVPVQIASRIERGTSIDTGKSPLLANGGSPHESPRQLPEDPPLRTSSDIRSPGSASPRSGSTVKFSLREGAGARRLAESRCRASVQLLIVQSLGEIYAAHSSRLTPEGLSILLDVLKTVSNHARAVNSNLKLRQVLAYQQSTDKVPEEKQLPDPPLLRLESEGSYAYLSMLLHVRSSLSQDVQAECHIEERMVELSTQNLRRYQGSADEGSQLNQDENVALSPLLIATLKAIGSLSPTSFKTTLRVFFPLLTALVSCPYSPPELQMALSELLAVRIGPLLIAD